MSVFIASQRILNVLLSSLTHTC